MCDEELEEGIRAVSAPVKNVDAKIEASYYCSWPVTKVPIKSNSPLVKFVIDAGKEISRSIGSIH